MDGNASPSQLALKVGLRQSGDFGSPPQSHTAVYEQADRQVRTGLILGQFQPAKGFVLNFDEHD